MAVVSTRRADQSICGGDDEGEVATTTSSFGPCPALVSMCRLQIGYVSSLVVPGQAKGSDRQRQR